MGPAASPNRPFPFLIHFACSCLTRMSIMPVGACLAWDGQFLSEIKTTTNLQHPNILPLHDSGEADGFLFFVMPYVEGESLQVLISARVSAEGDFRVLDRTVLFSGDHMGAGFDVMPDGEHFVMFLPEDEQPSKLVVITNFLAEIEHRLQALAGGP